MAAAAPPLPDPGGPPAKKGPSLVLQAGLLVGLTVMALGLGWVGGGMMPAPEALAAKHEAAPAAEHAASKDKKEGGGHGEEAAVEYVPGQPAVVPLAAITTNLAAPTDVWLRLELALEFTAEPDSTLAETIATDFLAYLRTVKLYQLSGPSGLLHLKADLDERAKIRSEGKVAQVFVRAMIFE